VWNVSRVGEQAADLTPTTHDHSFPGPSVTWNIAYHYHQPTTTGQFSQ
jgi:hypothetical protein